MKYPYWGSYTYEQMQAAVNEELRLVTHNATTREDLLNIMRFLADQVATLTEAMGKKDEAIDALHSMLFRKCSKRICHLSPEKRETCGDDLCQGVVADAYRALSLSPASVAQHAEEARIGRAVVEWYRSQGRISIVLNPALEQLGEVIAKARQQDKTE